MSVAEPRRFRREGDGAVKTLAALITTPDNELRACYSRDMADWLIAQRWRAPKKETT